MIEALKDKIISFVFKTSPQPVLLHELLMALRLHSDGMHLDGKRLGFRLQMGRAYLVFVVLVHIAIIPGAALLHDFFVQADCHASIVVAVLFTGLVFAFFGMFKDWLSDAIAIKRIKSAWRLHFPHFPYDEYKDKVLDMYKDALERDISNKELERFILDQLISSD